VAGEEHLISLDESEHPWSLLLEVARATPPDSWVLVGGLMVHVHALRAGVNASRPTRDIDLALNISAVGIGLVAGPLQRLGFRPIDAKPVHRFTRGDDVVDIMVGKRYSVRWAMKPVLAAEGAQQAIDRRDWYVLRTAAGDACIGVPDPLAAIVAKAAAYQVDQRDRDRHLEDLAVLLASSGGRRRLGLERLTSNDKRRLRHVAQYLGDEGHAAWMVLDEPDRVIAQRAFAAVADQLG